MQTFQLSAFLILVALLVPSRHAAAADAAISVQKQPAAQPLSNEETAFERLIGFWKVEAGAGLLSGNIWGMRVGALRFVSFYDLQIGPSFAFGSSSTAPKLNSDGYEVSDSNASFMEIGINVRFPVILPWLIATGGIAERIFNITYEVESENDSALTKMNAASLGIKGGVGSAWDVAPGIQVGVDWISALYPVYVVDNVASVSASGSLERVSGLLEKEAQRETDKLARGMNIQLAVAYASYEF